jgi:hypothetical protein
MSNTPTDENGDGRVDRLMMPGQKWQRATRRLLEAAVWLLASAAIVGLVVALAESLQ